MTPFKTILSEAERRNGGKAGLAAVMPKVKSPAELAAVPDDRYPLGNVSAHFPCRSET